MMRLYFLRHGKAEPRAGWKGDDGARPLTQEGEAAIREEAKVIKAMDLRLEVIVTSPLERARRTAELVADELGMAGQLVVDERLAHGFDVRRLTKLVAAQTPAQHVMVVGHEPEFSQVVAQVIGGGVLVLKKGGLARVDVPDGSLKHGELVWLLTPPLLGGS